MAKQGNIVDELRRLQVSCCSAKIDRSLFSEEELRLFQQQPAQDNEEVLLGIKNRYNQVIAALEAENKQLRQSGQKAADEKKQLLASHHKQQDKLLTQLQVLRRKHLQTDSQFPLIKEALAQVKEMLAGNTSESTYLRLRNVPDQNLDASEWVLVQVWEIAYPFKREAEMQRKEIFKLREELRLAAEKTSQHLVELEHQSRLLGDKDEDNRRHLLNYENQRRSLELELQRQQEELDSLKRQLLSFHDVQQELKLLQEEKKKAKAIDDSGREEQETWLTLTRKADLLAADKAYLAKENVELLERNRQAELRLDRQERELLEAREQARDYLTQLLSRKDTQSPGFEQKFAAQLAELRQTHGKELETVKLGLVEVYEKQLAFLREAKDAKELELESLQARCKERQHVYERQLLENANLKSHAQNATADLRIQLAIKAESLQHQQNLFEEAQTALKVEKLDNRMLREQLSVLKAEYYKLEAQNSQEAQDMRAELLVAKEQLRNYEAVEQEIDEAVLALTQADKLGDARLPTRRMKQAVSLAQRLGEAQKQSETLQKALGDARREADELKAELEVARKLLASGNQPFSLYLQQIEDKDEELRRQRQQLKAFDRERQDLEAEKASLQRKYEQAVADIQKVLVTKDKVKKVQELLVRLAKAPEKQYKKHVQELLQEMTAILQTKAAGGQELPSREEQPMAPVWFETLKRGLKK